GLLRIGQQRLDSYGGRRVAHKQAYTNGFVVQTGINPSFPPTIGAFLFRKVALGSVFGTRTAHPTAEVDVEELPLFGVVMPIRPAMLLKENVHRLLHLFYILVGAGIEGILHDRLLGTSSFAEGVT